MVVVTELPADGRQEWDDFIRRMPGGLPMHLSGWQKVLQKTYGYRTAFLVGREANDIVGVLPLFLVRSRLLGNTLTSMPGAMCAADDEAGTALINHALSLAGQWGAVRLRLHDARREWPGNLRSSVLHEHWLRDLSMGADALWNELDPNLRRQVRKARKNEVRVEIDRTGDLLEPFYTVFCRFTREAGTPVFGRDFLQNVAAEFAGSFNIVVVWHKDTPIGGYFQLEMGHTVYGVWGATLRDYLNLRPVHLAMWELMADLAGRGFTCLDMGRSPANSNASQFKGQWGGVRAPVFQQVQQLNHRYKADAVANGVDQDESFRLFMRVWPRLPLSVTQYIGPHLRRHLPFA